jgi:ubiquinone/menaquinone biosynthesis C-methylase UbiE
MMAKLSPSESIVAWEAAYLRFETPEQEVRKFIWRLRRLGAAEWPGNAAILELFCGRGNGLVALDRLGFTRVRGIDLSLRLLRRHERHGRCAVGDCRQMAVNSSSHDIAIVHGGLHHLPLLPNDLELTVAEVRRILKPSGLFVVVEPWKTPFLDFVHTVGSFQIVRRLSQRMDALMTMTEHELETYERWLSRPHEVERVLTSAFEPVHLERRWGKLLFVGRRRN